MQRRTAVSAIASILALSGAVAWATSGADPGTGPAFATGLTAADSPADSAARAGPRALAALLEEYDRSPSPALAERIDRVAGQHDAVYSRLYWYTDLDQARAAARAEHKPILYLRMLGKLTDEYSCANSRFFRTVLYANRGVSALLRDRFVLCWGSERPVPVITVDYGDGRILKRTITGNSAHYVLDADGRVFDIVPGLVDPATFTRVVSAAGEAAVAGAGDASAPARHQRAALAAIEAAWKRETVGAAEPAATPAAPGRPTAAAASRRAEGKTFIERPLVGAVQGPEDLVVGIEPGKPRANDAAAAEEQAVSKRKVEMPLVRAVAPGPVSPEEADEPVWSLLADRRLADARLDESSRALARAQLAGAEPRRVETVIDQFERSVALDSVRNTYLLRREALGWLLASPGASLEAFNRRVYDELFLTPADDPWLGLAPENGYAALTGNGCTGPTP